MQATGFGEVPCQRHPGIAAKNYIPDAPFTSTVTKYNV